MQHQMQQDGNMYVVDENGQPIGIMPDGSGDG